MFFACRFAWIAKINRVICDKSWNYGGARVANNNDVKILLYGIYSNELKVLCALRKATRYITHISVELHSLEYIL